MEGSAIQSGESAEASRMTSEEAQAVIDLWAQRQRQFEDEATMPSTSELAEALNIPESEVASLLRKVRGTAISTQPQVKETTVVLHRPKWLLMALAIMLFLGLALSFIVSVSRPTRSPAPSIPSSTPDTIAPTPQ